METCSLIDVETNVESLLRGSMIDGDSYDQWYEDFEELLDKNIVPRMIRYGDFEISIHLNLYRNTVEFEASGEEESIRQLQQNREMQNQCVRMIHDMLNRCNEMLLNEPMAQIPDAYILWKNSRFYVEIAPGQKSLTINFNTVQFADDFDERDIEWEYLL